MSYVVSKSFCSMLDMSTQFYSVHPDMVQNVMGGTQLHTPQFMYQPTMNHQQANQQAQWMPWNVPGVPRMSIPWAMPASQQPDLVQFGQVSNISRKADALGKRKWEIATPDIVDL